ncbi:hypothetical protein GF412_05685, partial [Candidatus Micrarchaeota archaeon]|nr:hypothetical protein [Candidatus Micrarchaeota archaeon]
GEGIAFHEVPCPRDLDGTTLRESRIGERTGLTVVGIEDPDGTLSDPEPTTELRAGSVLLVIGDEQQVAALAALRD